MIVPLTAHLNMLPLAVMVSAKSRMHGSITAVPVCGSINEEHPEPTLLLALVTNQPTNPKHVNSKDKHKLKLWRAFFFFFFPVYMNYTESINFSEYCSSALKFKLSPWVCPQIWWQPFQLHHQMYCFMLFIESDDGQCFCSHTIWLNLLLLLTVWPSSTACLPVTPYSPKPVAKFPKLCPAHSTWITSSSTSHPVLLGLPHRGDIQWLWN